jgi:hypothetical protein
VSRGRFADGWSKYESQLYSFLEKEIQPEHPVRILPVDYSPSIKTKIGRYFFGADDIPDKDFRGGPFYAYFFGLYHAANRLVLHLDSDIFLGGGSQTWVEEAQTVFRENSGCMLVAPLPGPPHPEGVLIDQSIVQTLGPFMYELRGMSTRIFMIDKTVFETEKISIKRPPVKSQIKAVISRNPNTALPETLIRCYMEQHGFKRIDFLGTAEGLWSLHPPFRTKSFYDNLGEIISRITHGDLPESQYGYYDIVDELCDWTEGWDNLKKNRWWKRFR